jgi:hypothetical protein
MQSDLTTLLAFINLNRNARAIATIASNMIMTVFIVGARLAKVYASCDDLTAKPAQCHYCWLLNGFSIFKLLLLRMG